MAQTFNETRTRLIVGKQTKPILPRYVRLHQDILRKRWVLLAPERIVEADEIAADVLQLCDGRWSLAEIAVMLAKCYDAAPDAILADIVPLIQNLADSRYIEDSGANDAE